MLKKQNRRGTIYFSLNTDYFTDDFHKNNAALATWENFASLSSHDRNGNVVRLQVTPNNTGVFSNVWSKDYGTTWKMFRISTIDDDEYCMHGVEFFRNKVDSESYIPIIRFIQENILYELCIEENGLTLRKYNGESWINVWSK